LKKRVKNDKNVNIFKKLKKFVNKMEKVRILKYEKSEKMRYFLGFFSIKMEKSTQK
jgi:hypothetical protein